MNSPAVERKSKNGADLAQSVAPPRTPFELPAGVGAPLVDRAEVAPSLDAERDASPAGELLHAAHAPLRVDAGEGQHLVRSEAPLVDRGEVHLEAYAAGPAGRAIQL